jgi:hypothetical protein
VVDSRGDAEAVIAVLMAVCYLIIAAGACLRLHDDEQAELLGVLWPVLLLIKIGSAIAGLPE